MAWTTTELQEYLDVELSRVVEEAKKRAAVDNVTFAGTVTGFLLKTGLALAAKHGAPRSVIEAQVPAMIADAYGPQRDLQRAQQRRRDG